MKTQYGISKGQRISELKGRTIEMNQSEEYRENRPEEKGNKVLGTCDAVTKDFKVVLMNPRRRRKKEAENFSNMAKT